jgi:hypothetical protein
VYLAKVTRPLLLALLVAVVAASPAGAQGHQIPIFVDPGLTLDKLTALAGRGAVGILVPANGRETSRAQARAALEQGEVKPSYLGGGIPTGKRRVRVETLRYSSLERPPPGPLIVVGLPDGRAQPNDRVYPILVVAPGYQGLLTSSSTRLPGVVSIVDVAPTALGQDGALGATSEAHPVARLFALDDLIREKRDNRLVSALMVGALIVLLVLVFPRAAALSYATALSANLILGATETSTLWIVLVSFALAVAVAVPLALVLRSATAVGLALAAVLALYLASFLVDASWVAYSPWGPPQNGRFYGVSNQLETMLLVPALASAALLVRRLGWLAFAAVAVVAFLVVAGSRFGADGGGALVLAAGYAVLAALLAGLRGRRLALAVAGTAAAAGALIGIDAATGGSSHVTRAIGNGPGSLASHFGERLHVSWERVTGTAGPGLVTLVSVVALAYLVLRLLRSDASWSARALPLGFAAAVAVSLLVNDSPSDVASAGLVGYLVCEAVMLRARCAAASSLRSFWAAFWPAVEERPSGPPPQRP